MTADVVAILEKLPQNSRAGARKRFIQEVIGPRFAASQSYEPLCREFPYASFQSRLIQRHDRGDNAVAFTDLDDLAAFDDFGDSTELG